MPPWIDYCSLRLRVKGKSPNRVWCKGKRTVWGVEGTVGGNLTKFTGHLCKQISSFPQSDLSFNYNKQRNQGDYKRVMTEFASVPFMAAMPQRPQETWSTSASLQTPGDHIIKQKRGVLVISLWLLTRYFRIKFSQMHWIILVTHPCPLMLKLKQPSLSHPSESAPH